MRLTVYTDYALRVLMYVAARPEPLPTIGEIADAFQISRNHLMKVVYELAQANYLETVRGKKGGLRLARLPTEVNVGRLVRLTEPDMALAPCFAHGGVGCAITPGCRLRGVLAEARAAFFAVLDSYTLADLTENPGALDALLGPRRAA